MSVIFKLYTWKTKQKTKQNKRKQQNKTKEKPNQNKQNKNKNKKQIKNKKDKQKTKNKQKTKIKKKKKNQQQQQQQQNQTKNKTKQNQTKPNKNNEQQTCPNHFEDKLKQQMNKFLLPNVLQIQTSKEIWHTAPIGFRFFVLEKKLFKYTTSDLKNSVLWMHQEPFMVKWLLKLFCNRIKYS